MISSNQISRLLMTILILAYLSSCNSNQRDTFSSNSKTKETLFDSLYLNDINLRSRDTLFYGFTNGITIKEAKDRLDSLVLNDKNFGKKSRYYQKSIDNRSTSNSFDMYINNEIYQFDIFFNRKELSLFDVNILYAPLENNDESFLEIISLNYTDVKNPIEIVNVYKSVYGKCEISKKTEVWHHTTIFLDENMLGGVGGKQEKYANVTTTFFSWNTNNKLKLIYRKIDVLSENRYYEYYSYPFTLYELNIIYLSDLYLNNLPLVEDSIKNQRKTVEQEILEREKILKDII